MHTFADGPVKHGLALRLLRLAVSHSQQACVRKSADKAQLAISSFPLARPRHGSGRRLRGRADVPPRRRGSHSQGSACAMVGNGAHTTHRPSRATTPWISPTSTRLSSSTTPSRLSRLARYPLLHSYLIVAQSLSDLDPFLEKLNFKIRFVTDTFPC